MSDVIQQYYEKLFNLMFSPTGKINVPSDFHSRVTSIDKILSNDKTALISTILEFMVNCGKVPYSFDAKNDNLNKALNEWAKNVNKDVNIDIPKGLRNFTEQYMRERLRSSLNVIRMKWNEVDGVILPTRMWLMDGNSIYVKNPDGKLNTNQYYFGKPSTKKGKLLEPAENETILIRKPYNQWYDTYPVPYLVRKGTLYHALFKEKMLERCADVINTAFPYQLFIKMGTEQAINQGKGPSETELKAILDQFKKRKQEFDEHVYAKGLAGAFPSDVKFEELIPSYEKVLDENIFKPIDKNLLASLGMIELKGFSQNREEMILNPKVLVEEVVEMVNDYTDFLIAVMDEIKLKNSNKYTFNTDIEVSPGIIESFITDEMRTLIRSLYDRGLISMEDTLEDTTPLKFKTQVQKRDKERKTKLNKRMYPRIVQNLEKDPADLTPNDDDIPDDRKPNSPESKNFKNACNEIELITAPMKTIRSIPKEIAKELTDEQKQIFKKEFNKGLELAQKLEYDDYFAEETALNFAIDKVFIKAPYDKNSDLPKSVRDALPSKAQTIFRKAFNSAIKQGLSEERAFKIAWSAVKKAGYYKDKDGKWKKRK